MNQYLKHSAPVFAWLGQINQDINAEQLNQDEIVGRLDKIVTQLRHDGHVQQDIDLVLFALVSLVDECVMQHIWPGLTEWQKLPLQQHYFDTNRAGEQFFEKLQICMSAPERLQPVLELYYVCLCCGFSGRYRFERPEALVLLKQDVQRYLTCNQSLDESIALPESVAQQGAMSWHISPRDIKRLGFGAGILVVLYLSLSIAMQWQQHTVQQRLLDYKTHFVRID